MFRFSKLGVAEAFAALLVFGCATAPRSLPLRVEPGDTAAKVRKTMGRPKERQAFGHAEAWQYCRTGVFNDSFVAVIFLDGRVSAVQPYRGQLMNAGQCSGHFRPIRWDVARA